MPSLVQAEKRTERQTQHKGGLVITMCGHCEQAPGTGKDGQMSLGTSGDFSEVADCEISIKEVFL